MRTPPLESKGYVDFLDEWYFFCLERANMSMLDWVLNGFSHGMTERNFIRYVGREKYDSFFAD